MSELGTQLEIETTPDGVRLVGEVDAHTAPKLESALEELVASDARIVTALDGVTFMDSSGLRVVIAATEKLRAVGGDLVLSQPTDVVRRLLGVSGLEDHLTIEPAG